MSTSYRVTSAWHHKPILDFSSTPFDTNIIKIYYPFWQDIIHTKIIYKKISTQNLYHNLFNLYIIHQITKDLQTKFVCYQKIISKVKNKCCKSLETKLKDQIRRTNFVNQNSNKYWAKNWRIRLKPTLFLLLFKEKEWFKKLFLFFNPIMHSSSLSLIERASLTRSSGLCSWSVPYIGNPHHQVVDPGSPISFH